MSLIKPTHTYPTLYDNLMCLNVAYQNNFIGKLRPSKKLSDTIFQYDFTDIPICMDLYRQSEDRLTIKSIQDVGNIEIPYKFSSPGSLITFYKDYPYIEKSSGDIYFFLDSVNTLKDSTEYVTFKTKHYTFYITKNNLYISLQSIHKYILKEYSEHRLRIYNTLYNKPEPYNYNIANNFINISSILYDRCKNNTLWEIHQIGTTGECPNYTDYTITLTKIQYTQKIYPSQKTNTKQSNISVKPHKILKAPKAKKGPKKEVQNSPNIPTTQKTQKAPKPKDMYYIKGPNNTFIKLSNAKNNGYKDFKQFIEIKDNHAYFVNTEKTRKKKKRLYILDNKSYTSLIS